MTTSGNEHLQPYHDYLVQLESVLAKQARFNNIWQTQINFFPPEGQANNVSFKLYKSNWFNDISDGIHFETWFGKADIKRQAFPISLHVEASKDKTGLQRGVFNQYVLDEAGSMIAEWEGYSTSAKSYQLIIARIPFEPETLVTQLEQEYIRMMSLAQIIDDAITLATK